MMYSVMIVDDETNILNALRRVLHRCTEWEIEYYDSSPDALKRAQTKSFDLFLSDYRMPEMDGVKFLSETKQLQPDSMRIILSGYTDLDALLGAINDAEIYRFINKPWRDYELMATLSNALEHRKITMENLLLANQVREQNLELKRRKDALEELRNRHPALVDINWAPDGSIILDEKMI